MAPDQVERRLAVILAADVAGYSRLMAADEEGTLKTLTLYRGVMNALIEEHQGRVIGTAGDSLLAEFGSAVLAVRAAVAIQRALDRRNADLDEPRRMTLRIGIHLGDVMVQGSDLLGDGVNIAARLEQMAEPGSILVSGTVWEQIDGKVSFPCSYLGEQTAKNLARPVRAYRVSWHQPDMLRPGPAETPSLPDKPSIAVLPFTNMGNDAEQEYFADGISEDIITDLSKSRWLFVIARNTSFTYKGKAVDMKQVGRELGVRYLLEGSVRKGGNRVRITAQLIEAATGIHLWSERYDRDLADSFAVQDEITANVVGAIEPELLQVERQRAGRRSLENMDAMDLYMRGMWRYNHFTPEDMNRAETHMRRAIEIDPAFAAGHLGLARVLNARIVFGWSQDMQADRRDAHAAGRRAVELDDKDPYAHYALAWPCLLLRNHEQAILHAQKALDLMPNFALGYFVLGVTRMFAGRFEQAADPFQRAMRLSPHEPLYFYFANFRALTQYHRGLYEEAAETARAGLAKRPMYMLYRVLAASYGQLGRSKEAAAALDEMRRLLPQPPGPLWDMIDAYADPAHRAHLMEGMRKAGWEE